MPKYTIDDLEIKISHDVGGTEVAIGRLIKVLGSLESVVSKGANANKWMKTLDGLNKSMSGLKDNSAKVKTMADSLNSLSKVNPPNIARSLNSLKKVPQVMEALNKVNFNKVTKFATAMNSLSTIGNIRLGGALNSLSSVPKLMRQLEKVDFSKLPKLARALGSLGSVPKTNLTSTINALGKVPSLVTRLDKLNFNVFGRLARGLNALGTIGKSNLGSVLNSLSKVPKLAKDLGAMDMTKFTATITRLVAALRPLTTELTKLQNAFAGLPKRLQNIITANERLGKSMTKTKGTIFSWGQGLKTGLTILAVRRAAQIIGTWIDKSNEYVENLNLFTVSMGKYAGEAIKYADKVSGVLGIDKSEWIRNQGIFMSISKGFGIVEEKAAQMSKTLTEISYDISSFFNIDIETSFLKVRSGLAGELEPLRNLGYALDIATLQQVAYGVGINKNINTMTQAQKAQLRFIAIMEQSKDKMGDMSRTIMTPTNALRIFNQRIIQLKRALGDMLIPFLIKIIPYAQAVVVVLTDLANSLAKTFGFKLPTIDYSGLNNFKETVDDGTDSMKEFKRQIMGFDEVNILGDQKSNSLDNYDLGLDMDAWSYDFLGKATNQVNEMADKIKLALKPLQPFFEGLITVLGGAGTVLLNFTTGVLYPWLVDVGDWMKDNPETLKKIGEGLGYLAIGLTAVKVVGSIAAMLEPVMKFLKFIGVAKGDATGWTLLVAFFNNLAKAFIFLKTAFQLTSIELGGLLVLSAAVIQDMLGEGLPVLIDWLKKAIQPLVDFFNLIKTGLNLVVYAEAKMMGTEKYANYFRDANGNAFGLIGRVARDQTKADYSVVSKDAQLYDTYRKEMYQGYSSYERRAAGGTVESGQMFLAREAGPELVGTIGNKSAVANNDQIVSAIAKGVSDAIASSSGNGGDTTIINQIDGYEVSRATYARNQLQLLRTGGY